MAESTMGTPARPGLFLRNATGLVKAWSSFDAFVYSFWSVNLITLGLYGISFVYWVPDGQLLAAIVVFGVLTTFLVVTYSMLVSVMPRTGGDYAWQSRVLGGGLGFVLSITGWWFTLFLWAPIYANILNVQFFQPLAYTLGLKDLAASLNDKTGVFITCLIVLAFVSVVVTLGMEAYARIQKICFWIGIVGLVVVAGLLLINSQSDFQAAFNREATSLFGATGDSYQKTIDLGATAGYTPHDFGTFQLGPIFLLMPFLAFYLLWPNWGATLYGEVRGAKDIRKPFWSMFWGLWVTIALVALVMLLIVKTMGWQFYNAANAAWYNALFYGGDAPPVGTWPYPVMFAGWLVDNQLFQAALIIVMGLWFFGWAGTLFLSSTRVIFAAAFDRVLPSWAANISAKRRVPYGSLILMIVPSIVISAIWAYKPDFQAVFLDATAVLALTFFATTVAAIILPWRRKDLYNASPIANWKIAGIPTITIVGVSRPLLVTDPGVKAAGLLDTALEALRGSDVEPVVFDRVKANPGVELVDAGAAEYRAQGCDGLVAIGGGSSMDTAKGIGVVAVHDGSIVEYEWGHSSIRSRIPPMIAVPTTAGTGSEVTLWAVITDPKRKIKFNVGGTPDIASWVALIDPELTVKLPPGVTAGTGMDALAHAVECFTMSYHQPFTDAVALLAMEYVARYLRVAFSQANNLEARYHMSAAAMLAGLAYGTDSAGAAHAMSQTAGGVHDAPHGALTARLLGPVMEYNYAGEPERFARMATAFGIDTRGASMWEAAEMAVDYVHQLADDVQIPSLEELGFKEDEIPMLADKAFADPQTVGNPRDVDAAAYRLIYKRAFDMGSNPTGAR